MRAARVATSQFGRLRDRCDQCASRDSRRRHHSCLCALRRASREPAVSTGRTQHGPQEKKVPSDGRGAHPPRQRLHAALIGLDVQRTAGGAASVAGGVGAVPSSSPHANEAAVTRVIDARRGGRRARGRPSVATGRAVPRATAHRSCLRLHMKTGTCSATARSSAMPKTMRARPCCRAPRARTVDSGRRRCCRGSAGDVAHNRQEKRQRATASAAPKDSVM